LGGISGTSLAVTKSGPGTWTILSNGNSYTGATKVLAGTLIVSGSLSGTTAVSATTGGILEVDGSVNEADIIAVNGSVLRGNGLIGGATLVSGTLSPGYNSTLGTQVTGTMTSAASVSLDSNSVFAVRLGLAASGTDSDMLALTSGTATLGNAQLQLTLGSNFANAAVGTMYAIITDTASTTDISGQFSQGGTITAGSDTFNILYNENATGTGSGDDVVLDLTSVPEPGTWASMLAGMGMLVAFQRMRRRRASTKGIQC
jgi:autotransporter-associated beta strand protein